MNPCPPVSFYRRAEFFSKNNTNNKTNNNNTPTTKQNNNNNNNNSNDDNNTTKNYITTTNQGRSQDFVEGVGGEGGCLQYRRKMKLKEGGGVAGPPRPQFFGV
ncbi:hypothetical protein M8J77_007893 [Diaphorina citri]|nr:hypothetical protein M8J77_007893 [Diaphorina citri]